LSPFVDYEIRLCHRLWRGPAISGGERKARSNPEKDVVFPGLPAYRRQASD